MYKNSENLYNLEKKIKSTIDGEYLVLDQYEMFNIEKLKNDSYKNREYVGETIEKIAASMIKKYNFGIAQRNFYAYIMREIMRNVVEHAYTDEFDLGIFKNKREFGFVVRDNGIGIMKSLNLNPSYDVVDYQTALAFAIRPGITKTYKRDLTIDEVWQNSGFGLYMISSIAKKLGRFSITSGNCCLTIINSLKNYEKVKPGYKGCEIVVVLRNDIKVNTSQLLGSISREGNEIANNSVLFAKYADIKTASKASTLLQNE